MIRIGIELNSVVRDINKQYLKYYTKDINPEFDEDIVNLNVYNFIEQLPFDSSKEIKKFIYEDYPYELFGCAQPMTRNLHTFINGWIHELINDDLKNYEISFYSLNEEELSIQSTYFYLSKSGSRVRRMVFPKTIEEVFDNFDVVITANPEVMVYPSKNKKVISIQTDDNKDLLYLTNLTYNTLEDVIKDKEGFIKCIESANTPKHYFMKCFYSTINKIKNFFKCSKMTQK